MDHPPTRPTFPRQVWPILLILGVLVLLPVAQSFEAPFAVAAIAGVVLAWRGKRELAGNEGVRVACLLFACYWLPALISAPGSLAPKQESWKTVGILLRFLPFAVFACLTLRDTRNWPRVIQAIAAIVMLWLIDAWVQALTGYGIAGAAEKERLSGIFGAGNLKLGPALAVLSPFVLVEAREIWVRRGLVIAFVFLLGPILLSGERAAWLIYALVTGVFLWRETRALLPFFLCGIGLTALFACVVAVALHTSTRFDARVERSLKVLQGSAQSMDEATAGRTSRIWPTAWRMAVAHPINGVGVRAFRYAYPQFAGPNDAFVNAQTDEGAFHAHQIVLEVLSETGLIGLAFWIAGAFFALRAWWRASASARERALAPALALAVMTFPVNTHLAFYSAFWGLLFWWLLALYCASITAIDREATDAT